MSSIAKMGPPAAPVAPAIKEGIQRQDTNRSSNSRINRLPGMAEIAKGRQKMQPLFSANSCKTNDMMLPPTRTSRHSINQPKPPVRKVPPQKSLSSLRSLSFKKPPPSQVQEKPTRGRKLSQKQKDDRKRASQGYRDRQKVLNERNKQICEKLEARFDTFS